jgi:acyl dehydratase
MLKISPIVPFQFFRHFSDKKKFEMIRVMTNTDIEDFGKLSGDLNPIHFEGDSPIIHGALLIGIISGIIGTK